MNKTKLHYWAIALAALALFTVTAFAEELPKIDWKQLPPPSGVMDAEPEGGGPAPGATVTPAESLKPYGAGSFSGASFVSLRVHEFDGSSEDFGGGLFAQYMLVDNIAFEANFVSEGLYWNEHAFADSFTDAGANFKGYLPIGDTGFAPYGFVGYSRGFEHDENRANFGAGIELRANKVFLIFADGQWTHDFEHLGHALFRLGGGIYF